MHEIGGNVGAARLGDGRATRYLKHTWHYRQVNP